MTALYLTQPAIVTCMGEGIEAHLQPLLRGENSPLRLSERVFAANGLSGEPYFFGEISVSLREFPTGLENIHHSRNNRVLWHGLAQIEDNIIRCIERFGTQRIAVVMGTSTTGVDENIPLFKRAALQGKWSDDQFNQQQQLFSAPADFIRRVYGLQGLNYGISTACTSGARALISAARLLRANLCDAVICGGVDTLSPLTVKGFAALSVLAPQRSNPFSVNRNGINIGEGTAVFIMTREALDRDGIRLLGYGSSSDAYHMSSPHPAGEGAIAACETALNSTALSASQIGWVNLHGTGTQHNDQMESLAVTQVFGEQVFCTSTKPYTGHTLGAAGAVEAGILWAVLSRRYNPQGKLPAQHWDGISDQHLALLRLTDHHSYWPTGRRIGASSSFAFGGNNTVLILGEGDD
ncbi:beta-ketoacyl-ACP synthase [Necropsobacter massiliensis]|uniref:beta-ketoacyl-ACP synthase n=1 Tax=Necropsobacter massiliensis TaxID=1400001 RepID=UPI00059638C6|nr:beta-ketoacyl-ACP synthase [Necropsobacter massiliensis]